MTEHYEMRLLGEFIGNPLGLGGPPQAANTKVTPTPLAIGGELETDERGEISFAEIYPPVSAGGLDEELRQVTIILDGHDSGSYVSLSGIRSNLMVPPSDRILPTGSEFKRFEFGIPGSNNPLLNTTLKYKQNVTVSCLAGPTAITGPYTVRLWGKVYKAKEIPGVFGEMKFQPAQLNDLARGRSIRLDKWLNVNLVTGQKDNMVNADNWLTLPGGKDQSIPKINPFARYAYNLLATDARAGDYQFRLQTGGVSEDRENMYFNFDDRDALLVKRLGVAPANDSAWPALPWPLGTLARLGLRIDGFYHPKGPTTNQSLFPTNSNINQKNYGLFRVAMMGFPIPALDTYMAIPKLDRPYLIWNEIGMVVVRDDATALVAANSIVAALTGIRIEMRS